MLKHQTITFFKSNFVHHFRLLVFLLRHFRSSRPEVFCKKGVFRKFVKFTGKCLYQTLTQLFSCEFCKISKNTPFYKTPLVASSGISGHGATKVTKIEIIVPTKLS